AAPGPSPDGARDRRGRGRARTGAAADDPGGDRVSKLGFAVSIAFTYFTIIYLTGIGGLFSERSGIVNIGLEGLMIIGTVTGSWGADYFGRVLGWGVPAGPLMGLLIGLLCGAAFASIHALATVTFKIDHIVSGVVINLVAIGLARFLSTVFFGQATQSDPGRPHLSVISIPVLSSIPGFGRAFQGLSPFVLFPFLIVFPVWWILYRTRWGLRLRSAGGNPLATRSLRVALLSLRGTRAMISRGDLGVCGAF